ncbi:MAG TPA: nucleotidyltransferase domain-containing protein [Desulfobacterales bacterium]|nr:nucleotidyltransferase domain-containing protein [Desulfobacterales bacterium]
MDGDLTERPMHDLAIDKGQLAQFCRERHIRRLSLYGSTIKDTARPDSDIDLLVEFERDSVPGLLALVTMEAELGEMLGGRTVDLRTPRDLSPHFRDEVMRTAEIQYAA